MATDILSQTSKVHEAGESQTATLTARWLALNAASNARIETLLPDEQVQIVDEVILDELFKVERALVCSRITSAEEARGLLEVAAAIHRDGPRTSKAEERIILSVADYLRSGGSLWDNH